MARSGFPSPLKSPVTPPRSPRPPRTLTSWVAWKVPSPLPRSTDSVVPVLWDHSGRASSSFPSPLKPATTIVAALESQPHGPNGEDTGDPQAPVPLARIHPTSHAQ